MKFPLSVICQNDACKASISFELHVDHASFSHPCPACGRQNYGMFGLDTRWGWKVLQRARFEIDSKEDYSMSIVLSAMAVEGELSYLYFKWKKIDLLLSGREPDQTKLNDALRKFGTIAAKIEGVAQIHYPAGIEEFITLDEVAAPTLDAWPGMADIGFSQYVQEQLFWKRNAVVHTGFAGYIKDDAVRCHALAHTTLWLFNRLDTEKQKAMGYRQ